MKTRKKKFKRTFKLLTFALTLILLMSSMPLTLQAMAIETDVNIEEVEEYREEYSKHFKMPDGTYKAVSYTAPVHRMDENGEWKDLENILSENTVKNKQAYVTADGRTVFSKKISADDNTVFELNDGGYSMKVSFENEGIKNSNAKLSNHAKKYQPTNTDDIETQYKKLKEIDTNTTVKYKNIIKNIDLEYILSANDIKENIIIRKACDDYEFSFIYELEGLSATLCENGSVAIYDSETNEVKYSIPAPYMYDDDGVESTDVTYSLDDLGNGIYRLTVTPDKAWINAEDRAFPVIVDPTVELIADFYDSYIDQNNPTYNYCSVDDLWVSSKHITFMNTHGILPTLPTSTKITGAVLKVYYYYYISTGYMQLGVYQVTFPWSEASITWNTADQYEGMGISPYVIDSANAGASSSITSNSPGMVTFNVTDLLRSWYEGGENYGIAIQRMGGTNGSVIIKSMEAGASTRSLYEITYSTYNPILSDGTYYIENVGTGRYIDVEGPSQSTGANIQQWDFHTGSSEKWLIENIGGAENYVRIKSTYSNLYIGVDSTNTYRIKQNGAKNIYTMWKVERTAAGNYKFTCRASKSSGKVLSVPLEANSNGTDLTQVGYMSDSNYRDEWELCSLNLKYVNYYDSTFVGNTNLINNISSAVSFSNSVYSNLCGITFEMDGSATRYTNFVSDQCSLASGSSCDDSFCGSVCSSHHKNLVNISDQFYNMGIAKDERYVIWTNRPDETYCEHLTYGYHFKVAAIAVVYQNRPVIHFMNIEGTSNQQKACMTLNLVHETAHTFGMPDVYGAGHDLVDGYVCIMEKFDKDHAYDFYQDILDGIKQPFCDSCTSQIRSYALINIVN